ncbi:hypothetical protein HYU14_05805 [Candidatus Woesearchaeota archaeon]|nr:hypothetical protein [Candidatus Woesearchaeota archaeon]
MKPGLFWKLIVMFALLAPAAFSEENESINESLAVNSATVAITSVLDRFNLGEMMPLSFSVIPSESDDALVKASLICPQKELLYFVFPAALEGGKKSEFTAPPLQAFSEGVCSIRVDVESLKGDFIAGVSSNEFLISNLLTLSFDTDKSAAKPGEGILVTGNAKRQHSAISKGGLRVSFQDMIYTASLEGSDFSYTLTLGNSIKSGPHTLLITVNDSFGNTHTEGKDITVLPVLTTLEQALNKKAFKPRETLEVTPALYDQANDTMAGDVNISLSLIRFLLSDISLFSATIPSETAYAYLFNQSLAPGPYSLRTASGVLVKEENITILPTYEVEADIRGNTVIVRNIGNMFYNNKTVIYLEKGNESFVLNKKVKLDVGEEASFNLSEELPQGNYTVVVTKEVIVEKIVEKPAEQTAPAETASAPGVGDAGGIAEIPGNSSDNAILASSSIEITEDQRPFMTRTLQGLGDLTGRVVAESSRAMKSPVTSAALFSVILAGILTFIWRDSISNAYRKFREKNKPLASNDKEPIIVRKEE